MLATMKLLSAQIWFLHTYTGVILYRPKQDIRLTTISTLVSQKVNPAIIHS